MISNLWHLFRRFARKLWARTALVSALAFVGPVLAQGLKIVLPDEFLVRVDREDVRALLDILANSMLAVTTFSLTIMVTAHLAADQVASPRAHRILREDGRTQTVLATFVGAFVFALVSIVMLQTGVLGKEELAALYLMTLVVLGLIIVTILRWIGQLSGLGSTENTTLTVQERAAEGLRERCASPFLGGRALSQDRAISEAEHAVAARQSGYVQNIDMQELDEAMEEWSGAIYLCAAPGAWVAAGDPLALVTLEDLDGAQEGRIASAFVIGATRTYGQDAAFGMSVLTEIAERALSPSINDPRTAIDVVSRLSHLLQSYEGESEPADPACRHVFAPMPPRWLPTASGPSRETDAASSRCSFTCRPSWPVSPGTASRSSRRRPAPSPRGRSPMRRSDCPSTGIARRSERSPSRPIPRPTPRPPDTPPSAGRCRRGSGRRRRCRPG